MPPLDAFLPAVQAWFRENLGLPTPPQAEGWPAIQRGEHTLILSPTGSGKTLAAFLWGSTSCTARSGGQAAAEGVRLLYVSPLKALNNDVERNLRLPLAGIRRVAQEQGAPLPACRSWSAPATRRSRRGNRWPSIRPTS